MITVLSVISLAVMASSLPKCPYDDCRTLPGPKPRSEIVQVAEKQSSQKFVHVRLSELPVAELKESKYVAEFIVEYSNEFMQALNANFPQSNPDFFDKVAEQALISYCQSSYQGCQTLIDGDEVVSLISEFIGSYVERHHLSGVNIEYVPHLLSQSSF